MYGTEVTDRQRAPLGGAGLFSTASDVGKFYQMTLNRGSLNGKRILKPETLAAMLTVQTGELTARPGMPWGYGFCIVTDPKAMDANAMLTPGSYGHGGAHGTSSWVDPAKGAVYVIMLQRASLRNPDNSDMHRVFQETADAAFGK
jgi:CubicO group peptidase (beta-lactamase class C family)